MSELPRGRNPVILRAPGLWVCQIGDADGAASDGYLLDASLDCLLNNVDRAVDSSLVGSSSTIRRPRRREQNSHR